MDVILKNVRCFSNRHRIRLRPLTLVTGENSSGKSTLLAIISVLMRNYEFPLRLSFNEPPFSLGNFENIATYKGGKFGRAAYFQIGFADHFDRFGQTEVVGTYTNDRGTPFLSSLSIQTDRTKCELKHQEGKVVVTGSYLEEDNTEPLSLDMEISLSTVPDLPRHSWLGAVFRLSRDQKGLSEAMRRAQDHLS